jgi:hypothetical protein
LSFVSIRPTPKLLLIFFCIFRADGTIFQTSTVIGDQLRDKIKQQDIICFKYHNVSPHNGKPIKPAIYRIASDLSWDNILAKHSLSKSKGKEALSYLLSHFLIVHVSISSHTKNQGG